MLGHQLLPITFVLLSTLTGALSSTEPQPRSTTSAATTAASSTATPLCTPQHVSVVMSDDLEPNDCSTTFNLSCSNWNLQRWRSYKIITQQELPPFDIVSDSSHTPVHRICNKGNIENNFGTWTVDVAVRVQETILNTFTLTIQIKEVNDPPKLLLSEPIKIHVTEGYLQNERGLMMTMTVTDPDSSSNKSADWARLAITSEDMPPELEIRENSVDGDIAPYFVDLYQVKAMDADGHNLDNQCSQREMETNFLRAKGSAMTQLTNNTARHWFRYQGSPAFNFTIKATDGGGLSSNRTVIVIMEDINDNSPKCNSPDPIHIPRKVNIEREAFSLRKICTDVDFFCRNGINGYAFMKMDKCFGAFSVDRFGSVRLVQPIPSEVLRCDLHMVAYDEQFATDFPLTVVFGGCPPDLDSRGLYWNDSFPGRTEYKSCPVGSKGRVTRHCSPVAVYDPPIYDCTSSVIANLQTEVNGVQSGTGHVSLLNVLDQLAKATAPASADLYAGDIDTVQNMLNVVQHIVSTQPNHTDTQKVETDKFLDVASNLVDKSNTESWKSLIAKDGSGTDNLLGIIDTYAETIATSPSTGRVGEDLEYVKTNLVLKVHTTSKCSHNLQYPGQGSEMPMWIKDTSNKMQLPCGSVGAESSYAGAVYRDLSDTMPLRLDNTTMSGESSHFINGPVMSFSLYPKGNSTQLTESIEISFQVFDTTLTKPECAYWNINTSSGRGMWSTDGCVLKSYSQTDGVVVCLCNHLTNFAILMSPGGVVDEDHAKALSIISAAGCTLSMLCLFVAFIVYIVYWRFVRCDRAIIHMNLYVCLFVAYGLFLGGVTRTNIKLLCTIIAALLHYTYLVVFMLMLTEGLDLAIRIRNATNRRPYWHYMIAGSYALPAVIVGVSLVVDTDGYGNEAFCWLSTSSGLIYAFIAPAVIVILINTVVIVLAMKTLYQTKSMSKKTDFEKARAGLRSISVLLPIMGVTWLFGVFSVNEDTVAFQYLFAIFNSAQGLFIFIFHCVLNAKVQEGFQRTKARLLVSYSLGSEMQHSSSGTAATKSTSAS